MAAIFISYRRADSDAHAGRLSEGLKKKFGKKRVFIDVDGITPGENFRKVIEDRVGACDVLLALIGKNWVSATNEQGQRRLDDPNDFVRLEVAEALKRSVPVIPVLVQGATRPAVEQLPAELKALAGQHDLELRHTSWDADFAVLVRALSRYVRTVRRRRYIALAAGLAALTVAILMSSLALMRVDVPNVVCLPSESAKAWLLSESLKVEMKSSDRVTGIASRVVSQKPSAGTTVTRGAQVQLVASKPAAEPPRIAVSQARDAELTRALPGRWRTMRMATQDAFQNTTYTLHPDGRANWDGYVKIKGVRLDLILSGTWRVANGVLVSRIESTNEPRVVGQGLVTSAELLAVTDKEMVYRVDGALHVDDRIDRAPVTSSAAHR